MNRTTSVLFMVLLFSAPQVAAAANVIAANLIPDGTYTVKVENVIDPKHILVSMDNGAETTLAAGRTTVDFSKIKMSDQVRLSLINGNVMVYLDMGH